MSTQAQVRPVSADDPAQAAAALRAAGLRISTARRLIIEALFAVVGPISAARLASDISLDESSVYRNLEVLERHGLVRHLHLGHGPGLYLLACAEEAEYLYCERCGAVVAVAPEQLNPVRDLIRARFGYTPLFTHFAIVGLCSRCRR
jgi:Fur family ferric uptake transcriptional regulator